MDINELTHLKRTLAEKQMGVQATEKDSPTKASLSKVMAEVQGGLSHGKEWARLLADFIIKNF